MLKAERSVKGLIEQANGFLQTGEHQSAHETAAAAVSLDPKNPLALACLGIAALHLGDVRQAVDALAMATRGMPSSVALWSNYATALNRAGLAAQATDPRRRALLLEPNNPQLMFAHAFSDGRSEAWHRAAVLRPLSLDSWFNLGLTRLREGNLYAAAEAYKRHARLERGAVLTAPDPLPSFPVEPSAKVSRLCCLHRLEHDAAQLEWLRGRDLLPPDLHDEPERYRALIDSLSEQERSAIVFDLDDDGYASIARSWNRFVHLESSGWRPGQPALNDAVDWAGIDSNFVSGTPRFVVVDDLLMPEALARLRAVCWNSTFWHQIKGAGYLGTVFRTGFSDPLVIEIATQLQRALPRSLGELPVSIIWAYSYAQGRVGINPHADAAGVNFNFWIAPNDANLDPQTGGLVVYRKPAPPEWDFATYNKAPAEVVYQALGESRTDFVRVPHRENRGVMFDSRLIHETDQFRFAPGFTNRRINVTILYGDASR